MIRFRHSLSFPDTGCCQTFAVLCSHCKELTSKLTGKSFWMRKTLSVEQSAGLFWCLMVIQLCMGVLAMQGVLTYVILRPITAIMAMFAKALKFYNEGKLQLAKRRKGRTRLQL